MLRCRYASHFSREYRRPLTVDLHAALDLTAVSTTLPDGRFRAVLLGASSCLADSLLVPKVAQTFHSVDYSWIGSAYALTSTAFVPWSAFPPIL